MKANKAEERDQATIELGKLLYFDPRISDDHSISCNTCHNVANGGAGMDGIPTSVGINKQKGERNAPTVWNAKFLSVQFWDGRAPNLKEQAKGPITNPIEMGMQNHDLAVERIQKVKAYREKFKDAFGSTEINIDKIATAIARFEETLVTLDSPYDKYKAGDTAALTEEQVKGMELFTNVGCISCHSGDHFAGPPLPEGTGFFQKFPVFADNNPYVKKYKLMKDLGRYTVTQEEGDKNFWRVPQLRNIALTGPYFHNGSVPNLEEAVRVMAKSQLNRDLKKAEVQQIVAFLNALTGEIPQIDEPTLPQ